MLPPLKIKAWKLGLLVTNSQNILELAKRLDNGVAALEAQGYSGGIGFRGGSDRRSTREIAEQLVMDILIDPGLSLSLFRHDRVLLRNVIYALSFHPRSQQWEAAEDQENVQAILALFDEEKAFDPTVTAAGEYLADQAAAWKKWRWVIFLDDLFGKPFDFGESRSKLELTSQLEEHVATFETQDKRSTQSIIERLVANLLLDAALSLRVLRYNQTLLRGIVRALSFHPPSRQWDTVEDWESVRAIRTLFGVEIERDPTLVAAAERTLTQASTRRTIIETPLPRMTFDVNDLGGGGNSVDPPTLGM